MYRRPRLSWIGFTFGLLLAAGTTSNAFGEIAWARTLEEAVSRASGQKLIVADMYADWCGWCKKMDAETWPNPEIVELQSKYVFLKLNAEKEPDGLMLLKRFAIDSFPTTMILNPDGSEFDRILGFQTAAGLRQRLASSVEDPESFGNLKAREGRAPNDLVLRHKMGMSLIDRYQFREAAERFQYVIEHDKANKSALVPESLLSLAVCQASLHQYDAALATIDQMRKGYPKDVKGGEALFLSAEILFDSGHRAEARTRFEEFLKAYPEHRLAPQARKVLLTL
jgi:thioredoxin-like negative regulator of GroEL